MTKAGWLIRLAPLLLPAASVVPAVVGLSSRLGSSGLSFDNVVFVVVVLTCFTGRIPLLLAIGVAFVVIDLKIRDGWKWVLVLLMSFIALAAIDGYRIGLGLDF